MVIRKNYISDYQIQHRKMKTLVRKQCLLWAKMFSNGFVVVVGSQTHWYQGGENLKQVITKDRLGIPWATRTCVVMIIFREQSQLTGSRPQRVSWAVTLQKYPLGMTSSGSLSLAGVNFQCRIALSDPAWAVSSPLNPLSDCQMLSHRLALILPVLP